MTTVDFFNLLSDCDPKKSLIYKIEDDEYTIEAIHRINGKVLAFQKTQAFCSILKWNYGQMKSLITSS